MNSYCFFLLAISLENFTYYFNKEKKVKVFHAWTTLFLRAPLLFSFPSFIGFIPFSHGFFARALFSGWCGGRLPCKMVALPRQFLS
ncbi:hypothetical protein BDA99DRAFT_527573 [Phascolomyces articulosus]|uniref:Uncharacterized protein n=1 Tax=Phascolomyces articulosus TaxID=60185 RepID=A0AAD5JMW8_9FUNG|nr:hypothetical protein BDA99DRAFT_527573 [Phascolomyces articulosus]